MIGDITVRIRLDESHMRHAIVMREVHFDYKRTKWQVLATNGKWRDKRDFDSLREDEKLKVEDGNT